MPTVPRRSAAQRERDRLEPARAESASWSTFAQGRIQEGQHRSQDELGAGEPEEVGGSWEHRQLRGRDTDEVAVDVATTQLQEPDHVVEPNGVAVTNGDQRRRGDPLDVGVGPAGESRVELPELVQEILQLFGGGGEGI
jgi:hypothetical protein